MSELTQKEIVRFIEPNIQIFHQKRLDNIRSLRLSQVLARKNPYLFKAKNLSTAHDLIKSLLDAHLSSQEEGIFGSFLEELAIFICERVYGGNKSSAEGIDLEFQKDAAKYIVSIKSGPHWGNSRQIAKMRDDFRRAQKVLRTNHPQSNIVAINGCCYGKDRRPDKGDYQKICGQQFWEFISGDENLYTEIIEPLGHKTKERNEQFGKEYAKAINKFTLEFSQEYCDQSGEIMWEKLVKFNSGKIELSTRRLLT